MIFPLANCDQCLQICSLQPIVQQFLGSLKTFWYTLHAFVQYPGSLLNFALYIEHKRVERWVVKIIIKIEKFLTYSLNSHGLIQQLQALYATVAGTRDLNPTRMYAQVPMLHHILHCQSGCWRKEKYKFSD